MAESLYRFSPNYCLLPGYGEQSVLVEQVHPYRSLQVSEDLCLLASQFLPAAGVKVSTAIDAFLNRAGLSVDTDRELALSSVAQLIEENVLVEVDADLSIYKRAMAVAYAQHRAIPRAIADRIRAQSSLGQATRILDVAAGTGSLAIELAKTSTQVTAMDISRGFLKVGEENARREKVSLNWVHDSCNRLKYYDQTYDVIIVSQAFHWLDSFPFCQGIHRSLRENGFFFFLESTTILPPTHPLLPLLGPVPQNEIQVDQWFSNNLERARRLFDISGPAGLSSRIVPIGKWCFRQQRPFGLGYARAHFTDWHIESYVGHTKWNTVCAELSKRSDDQLIGTDYWSLSCFQNVSLPARSDSSFEEIEMSAAELTNSDLRQIG